MAWERRERGSRYYVRKVWRHGRCLSEYVGGGELANAIAVFDRYDEAARDEARQELRALRSRLQNEEAPILHLCRQVDGIVQDTLEACGYHRPQRHPWRKKRMPTQEVQTLQGPDTNPSELTLTPASSVPAPVTGKARLALFKKARRGDKAAFEAIFCNLTSEQIADFHCSHADSLLDVTTALAGNDLLVAAAFREKTKQVRDDLGYDTAPPLERLLIARIAACWLDVSLAEVSYRNAQKEDDLSMGGGEFFQRRIERAHRRYVGSIKALAEVRKLNLPDVTLQAIDKQINVVGVQANVMQAQG